MKKSIALLFFTFFFFISHFAVGQAGAVGNIKDSVYVGSISSDSPPSGGAAALFPHGDGYVNNDSLIQQYCKAHKLVPVKSASGLYYVVKRPGNGQQVKDSAKVSVNYKGSLMNGTVFDSNMKRKFHHKAAFQYMAGAGQIIKGFDEGDKLLHEGGSAILIIPPSLGYGDKDLKVIPPNSILIFEVHILKVQSKPGCLDFRNFHFFTNSEVKKLLGDNK